jgi:hypothetical protein
MKFTMFSADRLAVLALITAQFSALSLAAPTVEQPALEKRALPVLMGAAKSFAALAATTLTSSGFTVLTGNGGVWPGTAIVGFPPGTASGALAGGTVLDQNGQAACLVAYNNALSIPATAALSTSNLGGLTLLSGVYTFPTLAVTLTGNLTLNAAGNPKKQFIFLIDTTFTVGANAQVILINSAQPCNVYFIVGSSATIGASAKMQGNILAHTSIGASGAASNKGTWCALNAAVTLVDNALIAQAGTCPT